MTARKTAPKVTAKEAKRSDAERADELESLSPTPRPASSPQHNDNELLLSQKVVALRRVLGTVAEIAEQSEASGNVLSRRSFRNIADMCREALRGE